MGIPSDHLARRLSGALEFRVLMACRARSLSNADEAHRIAGAEGTAMNASTATPETFEERE
jgi:hypothetical protein